MSSVSLNGEATRLAALYQYRILDTPPDGAFDDVAFLAAQLCDVPLAAVAFLDAERVWYKAHVGLQRLELPRDRVFTSRLLELPDLFIVPDAAADERYAGHPLVVDTPNVRFYAGMPLITPDRHILGALEIFDRRPRQLQPRHIAGLRALARRVTARLEEHREFREHSFVVAELKESNLALNQAYDATLEALARALDHRDHEVEGHLERVAETTVKLARVMGVPEAELVHTRRGALLHDIGKMRIPDSILLKPGALTDPEWEIMHLHPVYAREMLWSIPLLRPALDIPYSHHERWDGEGYPRQLKDDEIPLAARVFAVVDVWDALQSTRPYRPGWSPERVADYIGKRSGLDFDPQVVEAFLKTVIGFGD
jgi:putative nucleotidyltransferase with HDIG domain